MNLSPSSTPLSPYLSMLLAQRDILRAEIL
uniref:Uncharacterized protein n=1 Tax=Rhizophora mucronata TaxID=61149 RepID=A0A2P2PFS0_RHIMU